MRSADPFAAPSIDPNLLGETADLELLADAIEIVREIVRSPALPSSLLREVQSGPDARTPKDLLSRLPSIASHTFHGQDEALAAEASRTPLAAAA